MATPAQVANDMAAQAKFWEKRDKRIEAACHDAARVIRDYLNNNPVDGRTYGGLHRRLLDLSQSRRHASFGIADNLDRASRALQTLHAAAGAK
ncbi:MULTISPECIES: hypothetical protein [unclassified Marinovum]|uniref:hypothetical protein n=1 Tax=unclassified Marinovum TaxID=2647166 RepID=UPI003EDC81D9